MKVLVNAYAVSPSMGSEPGMGWNWCVNMARHAELFIITESEFRDRIEAVLPTLPEGGNMHFYFLPVSDRIRRMCWNQGDWRFYLHYRQWQKRALAKAREICATEKIDVIHQLNMVGFREPGYLWKIPLVTYIWGPLGGMSDPPLAFFRDSPWTTRLKMRLKVFLNHFQILFSYRVRRAAKRAKVVICATEYDQRTVSRCYGAQTVLLSETGLAASDPLPRLAAQDGRFHLIWAGRFLESKQLSLALETLSQLRNPDIVLDIYGSGGEAQVARYIRQAQQLGLGERAVFHGHVPVTEVLEAMRRSDLFFFTSVYEVTSTVIMEAISSALPIVCFDTCGFGPIVDGSIGIKIPCLNPEQAVRDFTAAIRSLYDRPQTRQAMSAGMREKMGNLSWDSKMRTLLRYYRS